MSPASTAAHPLPNDRPPDGGGVCKPHPPTNDRRSAGPSATPVSASTMAAGAAPLRTRASRGMSSVLSGDLATRMKNGRPPKLIRG